MPLVIDASVMACWHFPDEHSATAEQILIRARRETILVPGIWWFEIRNLLLTGERKNRATPQQSARFLGFLAEALITIAPPPADSMAMDLARRHRLSFYDATYLELAQREDCPLATFDKELIAAAKAENVPLA